MSERKFPKKQTAVFTHVFVMGFGWEPTVLLPIDFKFVDYLGDGFFVAYDRIPEEGRFVSGDLFKGRFLGTEAKEPRKPEPL